MPGHARACRDMSPRRVLQTRPQRRAGNQADQSGADTKPSPSNQELTRSPWTPITPEPAFSSLYGSPAGAIKPFPTLADSADSLYPADSPCFADPPRFLAYPPPGVLPESDRPIKGPEQRSIGVVPSSRGVSYSFVSSCSTLRIVSFLRTVDCGSCLRRQLC